MAKIESMSRRFAWFALALGVGLAAIGAAVAFVLAGGPWALLGAVMGAVTGAFAPSLSEAARHRGTARGSWQASVERTPLHSWARLLDPRREVVGFIGREAELAALAAWCEDRHAGRLRLVTGPGGVGKTRLAVELVHRMQQPGWKCQRVADGKEGDVIGALREVTRARALLVVDYAESRVGLRNMLGALAGEQGVGIKVLLLARSTGDWWDQLGVDHPDVWDLVQSAREILQPEIVTFMVAGLAAGSGRF